MALCAATPQLRISYRTGRDDLVRDFYVPCLGRSVLYRRAVGYFTSAGLAHAAQGVASLVARHGRMRLVASPCLEEGDLEALQRAADSPRDVLAQIAARTFDSIYDCLTADRLNALAWLVADGALEVRLALRLDAQGRFARGVFHEKVGIFTDAENNHVAFAGSANETMGGLVDNFESIKVFWSWDDPQGRVEEELQNFEALWENHTPGLHVVEFTDVSKELLARFRMPDRPTVDEPVGEYTVRPAAVPPGTIPANTELRDYQKTAIRSWLGAKGRGILAMATGTGKTLTALVLACKVAEKNRPMMLLVVCPYIHLARQWEHEMARFGFAAVPCRLGRKRWETALQLAYQRLAAGLDQVAALVVTNDTFLSETFQAALQPTMAHHLLIADEVHNLGAVKSRQALPEWVSLRLGLSATPERHYDEAGTQALLGYFGGVIFEYGLAEAIAGGVLCPYDYYPLLVDLTPDEATVYIDLTQKIVQMYPKDGDEPMSEALLHLLIKRARLLGAAANKLPALRDLIRSLDVPVRQAIVYCGDGRVTDPAADEEERQLTAVIRLLGETLDLRVRRFTYEVGADDREEILQALRDGSLDAVVAIRCLDEGVDLPDVRLGFLLASSANPRQFVQRRGRLLRRAPGKTHATIYDFLVRPPDFGGGLEDEAFNLERRLFSRELARVLEFCETARNGPLALAALRDLRSQYNMVSQ